VLFRSRKEEESGGDFGRGGGQADTSSFGGGDFGIGYNTGGLTQRPSAYAHGGLQQQPGPQGAQAPTGGLVNGPGDGNDDAVPVVPAGGAPGPTNAYSNGEYVMPADVVSALGDGDTQSGAALLDQIVQTVRSAHTQRMGAIPPPVGSQQRQPEPAPQPASPSLSNLRIAG